MEDVVITHRGMVHSMASTGGGNAIQSFAVAFVGRLDRAARQVSAIAVAQTCRVWAAIRSSM
jgi:hypothetical protein